MKPAKPKTRVKVREQAEEIERLKRRLAVLDEWEQGHEEAHQRAVDDCPHEEKTWTCCATCHCVEIERRRKAEAEASEHESRANRWMVQAQHAEVELAVERVRRRRNREEAIGNAKAYYAERERAKRLEQALAGWLATESLPDCRACAVLDAGLPELALRPAAPEAKESDCTCGEQWPCPLHGGPPAAPKLTPSKEVLSCHCTGDGHKPDCAFWMSLSEQPDLPLEHEYESICPGAIAPEKWVCAKCGQPESVHRRKP